MLHQFQRSLALDELLRAAALPIADGHLSRVLDLLRPADGAVLPRLEGHCPERSPLVGHWRSRRNAARRVIDGDDEPPGVN
ncbi:hypothetical protein [Nocardioides abyssi]|uniref:Uncharacterized protein n=1 Tax=Nocardioides abyssi TaxID=3058370 RepID=A0ABT8EUU9_9ACTN|nr:hypothetical protein [Nocardioides abyssi]MDN4161884.1 hypothetical protein [Nocardioides abyssi]